MKLENFYIVFPMLRSFWDAWYLWYLLQDGKWGHVEADGKWSGKISKVMTEDYDFIISDIFITYLRVQIFDGSIAFDKVQSLFLNV